MSTEPKYVFSLNLPEFPSSTDPCFAPDPMSGVDVANDIALYSNDSGKARRCRVIDFDFNGWRYAARVADEFAIHGLWHTGIGDADNPAHYHGGKNYGGDPKFDAAQDGFDDWVITGEEGGTFIGTASGLQIGSDGTVNVGVGIDTLNSGRQYLVSFYVNGATAPNVSVWDETGYVWATNLAFGQHTIIVNFGIDWNKVYEKELYIGLLATSGAGIQEIDDVYIRAAHPIYDQQTPGGLLIAPIDPIYGGEPAYPPVSGPWKLADFPFRKDGESITLDEYRRCWGRTYKCIQAGVTGTGRYPFVTDDQVTTQTNVLIRRDSWVYREYNETATDGTVLWTLYGMNPQAGMKSQPATIQFVHWTSDFGYWTFNASSVHQYIALGIDDELFEGFAQVSEISTTGASPSPEATLALNGLAQETTGTISVQIIFEHMVYTAGDSPWVQFGLKNAGGADFATISVNMSTGDYTLAGNAPNNFEIINMDCLTQNLWRIVVNLDHDFSGYVDGDLEAVIRPSGGNATSATAVWRLWYFAVFSGAGDYIPDVNRTGAVETIPAWQIAFDKSEYNESEGTLSIDFTTETKQGQIVDGGLEMHRGGGIAYVGEEDTGTSRSLFFDGNSREHLYTWSVTENEIRLYDRERDEAYTASSNPDINLSGGTGMIRQGVGNQILIGSDKLPMTVHEVVLFCNALPHDYIMLYQGGEVISDIPAGVSEKYTSWDSGYTTWDDGTTTWDWPPY